MITEAPIHLSGPWRQLHTLQEAIQTIAEHEHEGACDSICVDNLREIAQEALEAAFSQQAPEGKPLS